MQTYKQIGETQLKVPRFGFGSAPIANLYSEIPETEAIETIQYALKKGINFIDTAPHYGVGLAEKRIGLALQGVDRDRYIIQTKVGRLIGLDGQRFYDYSYDGVMKSLEASLKRMDIDHVESLLIHDPDIGAPSTQYIIEETFPALAELKRQGVVQAIGIGINYPEMLLELVSSTDFDCFLLAGRYTLLEQTTLDALNIFNTRGISILAAGVFNSGILATGTRSGVPSYFQYKAASSDIIEHVQKIEVVCDKFDVDLPAAAIQFVANHPAITSLVIGMDKKQQIDSAFAYSQQSIPEAFWLELRDKSLIDANAPLPLSPTTNSTHTRS